MKNRILIFLLAGIFIFTGAVGCKPVKKQEYDVKIAPIHEIDIRFAESFPIQVLLYIKGGLSDGCTKLYGIEIKKRTGNEIQIAVTVTRPRDVACAAIYTYFEENLNLGTDFKPGESYRVTVNNISRTFGMP